MIGISAIADAVRRGDCSAVDVAREALDRLGRDDVRINAVTRILAARALAAAGDLDRRLAEGIDVGPLAGVPFGVKDLFDVAGLPTTAGSRLLADAEPAQDDARAIRRLTDAGAILVATLNMDEFAYGFTTENAFHGTTRNPHDLSRLAGGSSGGSAAVVASGMLPLALGSDTNGSIRVPASLCGVYGIKPTHGALPMDGVFPFVDSFDDIGPFTRSAADLALVWRVLRGSDEAGVPAATPRVALLGGWFGDDLIPELSSAIARLAGHLGDLETVLLPEVGLARSAAFLMTAAEGGARHLPDLRRRPLDFDPATRDRLIAGAALPHAAYVDAQDFRGWFREQVLGILGSHDILIAPSVGGPAPLIDAPFIAVGGEMVPARANLGRYTQPISFIGLPVVAVPLSRPGQLPLGLQLIGAPGSEAMLLAFAARLEAAGRTGFSPPPGSSMPMEAI